MTTKTTTEVQTPQPVATPQQALTENQKLKNIFKSDICKQQFAQILGQKSAGFMSSVLAVVNNNDLLKKATAPSVVNSALIAATLDLPINPNLGFSAIVPYYDGKTRQTIAQFQIMYRGMIQLAMRSGQVKTIIAEEVHEGELVSANKFTGEYVFDESARTSDKVIGYMAYLKLVNGFEKTLYMTIEEVQKHATQYSQTFRKGFGVWKDNFSAMAKKTVTKLLLSKYAPLSIEMQRAMMFDQASIKGEVNVEDIDSTNVEYVDNQESARASMLNDDIEDAEIVAEG